MSGNNSRKYKQFLLMQEKRKQFGSISMRDEYGILDPVACYAARKGPMKSGKCITKEQRVKGNMKP